MLLIYSFSFRRGCTWVGRRPGATEHFFTQGADHELSETCAFDIHDILQAADGQCHDQVSAAQPTQSFEFLMPCERIYNMALQFEDAPQRSAPFVGSRECTAGHATPRRCMPGNR